MVRLPDFTQYDVVIATGDRNWHDWAFVKKVVHMFKPGTWMIQGEAPGLDTIFAYHGREHGLIDIGVPYIGGLGRGGGAVRNEVMAKLAHALWETFMMLPVVVAFHPNLAESRGTKNMVVTASKHSLPVHQFTGRERLR